MVSENLMCEDCWRHKAGKLSCKAAVCILVGDGATSHFSFSLCLEYFVKIFAGNVRRGDMMETSSHLTLHYRDLGHTYCNFAQTSNNRHTLMPSNG